jgi:predicted ATPase
LWGLWLFYGSRGPGQTAQELAARLLRLAQRVHDPALLLEAYHAHWATAFNLGEFSAARAYAAQGVTLYERQQHHALAFRYGGHDPGVCCRDFGALALWMLGYPEQALQWRQDALALAHALAHPFSLAEALGYATWLAEFCREERTVRAQAEALMALAQEHGLVYWLAQGRMLWGWALVMQGHGEEGITHIHHGLEAYRATAGRAQPYYVALLAEAYGTVGESAAGLGVLAEAFAAMHKAGAPVWEATLYRLKGELLLQHATRGSDEAEACFQQALDVARRQEAKSLELRAATSLARLWQQQGKRQEAHDLLAPVYGWFTEGFDTADLQDAKVLLEELAR